MAAHCCGSAFLQNGSAFRQDLDEVGKTLVDWLRGIVHCVLIQHLKKISRIIHVVNFILSFLNLASKFQSSILILDSSLA